MSASVLGAPVSTTHVVATSIMGIGAAERPKSVLEEAGYRHHLADHHPGSALNSYIALVNLFIGRLKMNAETSKTVPRNLGKRVVERVFQDTNFRPCSPNRAPLWCHRRPAGRVHGVEQPGSRQEDHRGRI
jgi:hypothetical protein